MVKLQRKTSGACDMQNLEEKEIKESSVVDSLYSTTGHIPMEMEMLQLKSLAEEFSFRPALHVLGEFIAANKYKNIFPTSFFFLNIKYNPWPSRIFELLALVCFHVALVFLKCF